MTPSNGRPSILLPRGHSHISDERRFDMVNRFLTSMHCQSTRIDGVSLLVKKKNYSPDIH